jgi:hypothetical protein
MIDEAWVVLGIEYVESSAPRRPWRGGELDRCLDALETVAQVLTPVPRELDLDPIADDLVGWPALWDTVRARHDLPHVDEAAALAARFAEAVAGDTVVHVDVRDDNVLLTTDGRALFCDWNWPAAGASWLDSLFLLIGPRGDGLDVEAVIASRDLLRGVPADHIDTVLALVTGYFLSSSGEPVPPTSPYLRDVQRWQGEVVWDWLCERRGWR